MTGLYERKAKSQKKHPCSTSSSGAFRATAPPPSNKPGWKGPAYIHKKAKPTNPATSSPSSSSAGASSLQAQLLPKELQQLLLNIFRSTFPASNDFEALKPTLQEIKNALFERDFEKAFGKEEYLEAYSVRWSPSRTLGYANILAWLVEEIASEEPWVKSIFSRNQTDGERGTVMRKPAKIVSFGGGAAEIMAFAGLLKYLRPDAAGKPKVQATSDDKNVEEAINTLSVSETPPEVTESILDLHLVDTADWSSVIGKLQAGTLTAPTLSKYASASAKASNASLLYPDALKSSFTSANVLESSLPTLKTMIGPDPALLTLFFTLNELYSTSIPKTTKFLLELTLAAPVDSLLLVIDSPGSYSETAIGTKKPTTEEAGSMGGSTNGVAEEDGQEKKKYPMHWLMDHVLLEKGKKKEKDDTSLPMWKKVVAEESRWFRLAEGLNYPVSLENMRFQVHLFKRQ